MQASLPRLNTTHSLMVTHNRQPLYLIVCSLAHPITAFTLNDSVLSQYAFMSLLTQELSSHWSVQERPGPIKAAGSDRILNSAHTWFFVEGMYISGLLCYSLTHWRGCLKYKRATPSQATCRRVTLHVSHTMNFIYCNCIIDSIYSS